MTPPGDAGTPDGGAGVRRYAGTVLVHATMLGRFDVGPECDMSVKIRYSVVVYPSGSPDVTVALVP